MAQGQMAPGIASGRLSRDELTSNFSDLHPAYAPHEAAVAADRCYFCYDAPCQTACPTDIDIPLFIRQIQAGQSEAAARTILSQNILGGMCARVCPTETLCEEVCVRETAEGKPVEIGRLQRHATDTLMASGEHPFERAPATGKTVAVVGAGPAGLACAHRLAMLGNDVVIHEAKAKSGGLNEFGIAAYKSTNNFAEAEVDWLLKIGGITVETGSALGQGITLDGLQQNYDAVFLSIGLAGVNALRADGADKDGVRDAVDFIADLRQSGDLSALPVGRNVVVIGGGMTAIDAAVQSKLLGAENVTVAYRRSRTEMGASGFEQDLAASKGVKLMFNVQPVAVHGNGAAVEIELEYTSSQGGSLSGTGETVRLRADQVFKAIGQSLEGAPDGIALEGGKIRVDENGRTSISGVWAGGDCASGGEDLTVTAVAEGRDAAMDIHASLAGSS
ncbi:NAD(P)-dependent oxidoreductase [Primorskyibacter sp. S87]|uniref:NAD(P)-dependent oxidoreductase n=1 Tax=Primorskyibacter sp. S87 TaxID=3415126 RepID=UPI003C7E1BF1